jgi:hypothetical protein
MDFLALIQQTGFEDVELVAETGFNSSPKTKGVLIRAKKPTELDQKTVKPFKDYLSEYSTFSKELRTKESTMEDLLKKAYELGAEKAKIIGTETIVVEEWVRWKCLYGCPFHGKDAYHPPVAPDSESTKKVLKEYRKAILLNGPKGKPLTETAVRLEGHAYNMGYYKAFAMVALTVGTETTPNSGAT